MALVRAITFLQSLIVVLLLNRLCKRKLKQSIGKLNMNNELSRLLWLHIVGTLVLPPHHQRNSMDFTARPRSIPRDSLGAAWPRKVLDRPEEVSDSSPDNTLPPHLSLHSKLRDTFRDKLHFTHRCHIAEISHFPPPSTLQH